MTTTIGPLVQSFFEDHLRVQMGLRPASVRSYRDVLRLFLCFVAAETKRRLTQLALGDLTYEGVQTFLRHLEEVRGNCVSTRNHRRAALQTFFEYLARRTPEMLAVAQRIAAIAVKRTPPPETHYLEREEISSVFRKLPREGRHALRDRALLQFLYNTGARVQEVADVRVSHLDLGAQPHVQLHGKGDKWRKCPLWDDTARLLKNLIEETGKQPTDPVFCSRPGQPLTRFGIYKIVRRRASGLDKGGARPRRIHPHVFRHTAAVHLLESGVELNVIRGLFGHESLDTTNRYSEISLRMKKAALQACEPPVGVAIGFRRGAVWKDDRLLLKWLNSL